MRHTRLVLVFLLLLCCHKGFAARYVYDYNSNCARAYDCFMSLRFAEGNNALITEIKTNPYNLMTTFLGDYEDCLTLLFNGDKTDYEQRNEHLAERLELLSKGSDKEPWYRLCKAGINLHWALVSIRMGENMKAAGLFRKSYILLKENRDLFPAFDYNNVFLGLEQAALGAIPEEYKWIASMFGMRGDVKKGVGLLSTFVNKHGEHELLRDEAVAYHCYLKFYLVSQREEVWKFINSSHFITQNNLLNTFVKANLALNYRKADAAMEVLKSAQSNAGYARYPIFDYETANALFYKLDPGCIFYYQRFLNKYKGKLFVKDTWQKLSLIYYIQQNSKQAAYCRRQVETEGSTQVDADKQALRSCRGGQWPNISLLQARLLTDGGFYAKAFEKIGSRKESDYSSATDKLEFLFRMGRIYEETGDDSKAIQYYTAAINTGRKRPEQFAARAALQTGFIYEREGKTSQAISAYQLALAIRDHDFQASIDQQAKAGVNRLSLK